MGGKTSNFTCRVFKHDLMSLSVFSHNIVRVVISVLTDSCFDILNKKRKKLLHQSH